MVPIRHKPREDDNDDVDDDDDDVPCYFHSILYQLFVYGSLFTVNLRGAGRRVLFPVLPDGSEHHSGGVLQRSSHSVGHLSACGQTETDASRPETEQEKYTGE